VDERVYIGIGSNMGDGVRLCVDGMKRTLADDRARLVSVSSFYATSPVSPVSQDDFTNCAMAVTWAGSPEDLLRLLNAIERDMGRMRSVVWGPRLIDLDILLFGDAVLLTPSLTIPHPELHRRRFAIIPCVEIDPSLVHPVHRRPLISFLHDIDPSQEVSMMLGSPEVLRLILSSPKEGRDN
jgi:2-amino-4-hydroxy-6-hydroxymethyldihydropteridine diphosphokinase